jgi:pimeloyl-ACP methyl ester carboxylesterase
MSVPKSLDLPTGVEPVEIETPRGNFAAHRIRTPEATAHVLLVAGWTGSKEDFTPMLPRLAAVGFDATAYDQRGQFETPGHADSDYSLEGLATDAAAVADTCSSSPSHLLGHSFGGLVALSAVLVEPAQWRTLSLLGTGPAALGESDERPLGLMLRALDHDVPLADIHAYRENGAQRPADIAEFLLRRFTSNSRDSLRAMTQHLLDAPDRLDNVVELGLPMWVGRGEDDNGWPHDVQAEMARRIGVELHVISKSIHSPAVENPQGLADAWLPFLLEN